MHRTAGGTYHTDVPIIVAGLGIAAAPVARRVDTEVLVPIIAICLVTKLLSMATGFPRLAARL